MLACGALFQFSFFGFSPLQNLQALPNSLDYLLVICRFCCHRISFVLMALKVSVSSLATSRT
jgi:hypothetical protein